MDNESGNLKKMHEAEGRHKIGGLEKKIDTTQHNIEASGEIIADTPSNAQRAKLIEKNTQRKHAIGSMQKEIRDIEQTLEERSRERSE